jgi:hypothetical protein
VLDGLDQYVAVECVVAGNMCACSVDRPRGGKGADNTAGAIDHRY